MQYKNVLVVVFLFCCLFQCTVSTGILFNALKNTVQNAKCKLHSIGSKLIQHKHHNDPCTQSGNGGQANNEFGSQNGYQPNENQNVNTQNGYGNQENYYGNSNDNDHDPQINIYNGHSYGPSNGPSTIDLEISTSSYQTTDANPGQFSTKNNSAQNGTNNNNNNVDKLIEEIFGNSNITNEPIDNHLMKTTSENYETRTIQPSNNKTTEDLIEDIFGKPNIDHNPVDNNIDGGTSKYTKDSTEKYPTTLDIDVRIGTKKLVKQKSIIRKYENVPVDGGRNIFKVKCPEGKVPTENGECLEEW